MILSGFRAIRCILREYESENRSGRQRPDRGLPNLSVAIRSNLVYDFFVGFSACDDECKISNNSAEPIQRGTFVSRPLRLSDSQAQPSKGTQGNNGSNSPLAGGIKSRAVRSHLSLALGEFVRCNSRSPRRGNRLVSPKIEDTRRSEVRGSASVISFGVRNRGSQVSCASLGRSPPAYG